MGRKDAIKRAVDECQEDGIFAEVGNNTDTFLPGTGVIEQNTQSASVSNGNGDAFNTYDNAEQQKTSDNWVLNTNPERMKIHYPSCSSVKKISPENYATSNSSVAELVNQGYSPCGNCHPH